MNQPLKVTDAYGTGDSPTLYFTTDAYEEQRASDADDSLDDLNVLAEVITDWANFDAVATLIRSISRAAALNNVESVMVLAKSLGYEVEQGALKRIQA